MSVKGLKVADFPHPFGVEGDVVPVFAVIKQFHGREAEARVITVAFDLYASEEALDAGKAPMNGFHHSYTVTEIIDLTANSMDELWDTVYQVVKTYDPAFVNAEIVQTQV